MTVGVVVGLLVNAGVGVNVAVGDVVGVNVGVTDGAGVGVEVGHSPTLNTVFEKLGQGDVGGTEP